MDEYNNIGKTILSKQNEIPGFQYFTNEIDLFNLHLDKEALHNTDLPIYGIRPPMLKTSTFMNIFSLILENITKVAKFNSKINTFFEGAKEYIGSELDYILYILAYIQEWKQYCAVVERKQIDESEIDKIIQSSSIKSNIIEKLNLNVKSDAALTFSYFNFIEHYPIIKNLIETVFEQINSHPEKHNLGYVDYEKYYDLLLYTYLKNNDCNQLINVYKGISSPSHNSTAADYSFSVPILIHMIVYIYKLLYVGASFVTEE